MINFISEEGHRVNARYPFKGMAVGDIETISTSVPKRVFSAAIMFGKRKNKKLKCQLLSDGRVRITRLT